MNLSARLHRSAEAIARTSVRREVAQPGPMPTAAPRPPAGPAGSRRVAAWWRGAVPWLMAAVLGVALYLAYFAYDLLQHRLHESGQRFQASADRFERYWALYDAALESTLALKSDLACPGCPPEAGLPAGAVDRFEYDAMAFRADLVLPGLPALTLAANYGPAVDRALVSLRQVARGGAAASRMAPAAREQTQALLEQLAAIGKEARRQQSLSAVFRADVDKVRRQLLLAFSVIVAMLLAVVAVAAQWVAIARRERAIRDRAEHLAEVAEAERARAENVMRDKSRFLGMLSHELLTPLQSIWSTMDVIQSRGRVEAHEPAFTRLRESTRSLRARISDLVDFAKISSGRLETRIRGFQLDKLVDAALRGVEEELANRNLDVHWESGPELSERVYSDPARLRQIIDNLLTNAVKYTERGGITIHADIDRAAGTLRVEISDTGVGIQPEDIARMFEPFYRGPSTAGMAEGSGLGLAVVRSLVDLMGGSIRFDSKVGQGTSVVLEVPVADAVDGAADAPATPLSVRRPVLVVDDSRDARRAIADVIRALGLEVYEASGGNAGLAEAAERDYLAILLDMQMPDLNGYEVAARLRRPGNRHEKSFLVLVSAFHDLDVDAVDAVFDARIDKPASRQDLIGMLAQAAQAGAGPAAQEPAPRAG